MRNAETEYATVQTLNWYSVVVKTQLFNKHKPTDMHKLKSKLK